MPLPVHLLLIILYFGTSGGYSTPPTPYPQSLECGRNATRSYCSSRCQETCQYKSLGCPPRNCGGPCVCRIHYVIDESRSRCILRRDCRVRQVEVPSYEVSSVRYFGSNYGRFG